MSLFDRLATPRDFALPIVDAHHHLWDLGAGRYPTKQDQYDENFFLGDYRKICRDYMPTDYVGDLEGFRVIGSVHIQAGRATEEQVAETEWLETMHAAIRPAVGRGRARLLHPAGLRGDPGGPCAALR